MKTKELLYVSSPLKQLIQKHLSFYSVLHDGRGYIHLIEAISLLRNIKGIVDVDNEEKEILVDFNKRVNHIISFFSIINEKDFRDTSFYDDRFRNYYLSLQHLPLIHYKIIKILIFLLSQSDLINKTIPSAYLAQASKDIISWETEEEQRKKGVFVPRQEFSKEEEEF